VELNAAALPVRHMVVIALLRCVVMTVSKEGVGLNWLVKGRDDA
jgi:hypothetical protein